MAITMAVVLIVLSHTLESCLRLKPPLRAARRIAPTAPITPASVGVAMPKKMLPSTIRIKDKGGSIDCTSCSGWVAPSSA